MNKGYKILIIDNSAETRASFRCFLQNNKEFDYSFLEAELGETGIEICLAEKPCCVLLANNLPDTDGLAVIKQLNPDSLNPAFPVILLTGEGEEKLGVIAIKNGAQAYLVKSKVSAEELSLTIDKAVEIVRLRQRNKQYANEVQSSEKRYRSLFELAAVGIARASGATGRFEEVNDEFCRITGYSRDELLGLEFPELTHPDDRDADRELRGKLAHSNQNQVTYQKRYVRKNGQTIWVQITVNIVRQATGKVEYGVSIVQDITETRAAEAALRQSEERYRALVEASSQIVWTMDAQGESNSYLHWFTQLTGKTIEEIKGNGYLDLIHPDDRQYLQKIQQKVGHKPAEYEVEFRMAVRENDYRYYNIRGVPLFTEDGTLNEWIGTIKDINDVKTAQNSLLASQELLKLGVEVANFAICEIDYTKNTYHLSKEASHLYGLGDEEIIVSGEVVHATFHPDEAAELASLIAASLNPDGNGWFAREHRVVWKNGEVRWVNVRKQTFFDRKINPPRAVQGILAVRDITKRKRAEEEVLASKERMRLATQATAVGIWEWNVITNQVRWDAQMFRIYGIAPTQDGIVPYSAWSESVLPEELSRQEEVLLQTVRQGGQSTREFRIRRNHDGQIRYINSVETVRLNAEGKPEWVIGTNLDITELKQAEAETYKLVSIVESSDDAIISKDFNGTILSWNNAAERIFGFTAAEAIGQNISILFPPERLAEEKEVIATIERGERIRHYETVRKRKDGTTFPVSLTVSPVKDLKGAIIGISKIARDITERNRAEEELHESEARFRRVLAQSNAGIIEADAFGRMTLVNQRWCEMLGYSEAELLSMKVTDVTHSSSLQKTLDNVGRLASGGPDFVVEKNYQRKDGSIMPAVSNVSALRGKDGEYQGLVAVVIDMTERLQAEAEIKALSDYNRNVLESITDPLFTLDREWRFTYMSRQGEQVVMREPGELLGTVLWQEFPGLIGSPFEKLYRQAMDEGIAGRITDYFHDHQRWYEVNIFPSPTGVTVYFRNVTERIQREVQLAFLADLAKDFTTLSSGVEIMQLAGKHIAEQLKLAHCAFVEINDSADEAVVLYDHYEAGRQSLVGNYPLAQFLDEESERLQLAAGNTIVVNNVRNEPRSPDAAARFEALGIRAFLNAPFISDGRWKFALSVHHSRPYEWRTDEIELLQELSARIYLHLERARAEENLRESEARFRALFDSIDEGFCIIELIFDADEKPVDYRFIQANPAFSRLTELPASAIGKTAREMVPDLEEFWFETYGKIALTGEPLRFENKSETMNRWFEVFASRVGDESSRRVAIVFNNITDRKEIEARREKLLHEEQIARETAEATNVAKDEFLAVLSHELRSPLNAMLGWATMLNRGTLNPDMQKRAHDIIERNIRLQNALIEDLLDVSRIISGKMLLEPEMISFVSVVQNALEGARPASEAKNIKLEIALDYAADEMHGDSHRLQQIIGNILTNSIKFTPENGTIMVRLERAGDKARLTVKDNGIGISTELLPFIFERFQQADGSSKRKFGGLGLGLTIVKHLTEMHGGHVFAASEGDGKGATFTVELPLIKTYPAAESSPAAGMTAEMDSPRENLLENVRLLVVDDEKDALELLRFVLEQVGANVICVNSAREALQALQDNQFDLLISDVGMAGTDGFDLIRLLRANENKDIASLPAIALTGYVSAEDRERVLRAGFQIHLPKPLNSEILTAVALNLLMKQSPSNSQS